VLVGVQDDQTIVGLADDYADIKGKKADCDKYEQFLRNVFGSELGHDLAPNIAISFHTLEDKDVCRVAVKPAAKPVYFNGDLYIRAGNTTRKLSAQGAVAYIPQQWP
jgi:predicted HTH transcriptional regulator